MAFTHLKGCHGEEGPKHVRWGSVSETRLELVSGCPRKAG